MENTDISKKAVGEYVADLIKPNILLGLGTGSTVEYFIRRLAKRCEEGLNIHVVSSSIRSERLASELHIPIANIDSVESLDLTVDGADEIDLQGHMIKGGGGALLREKIIATMSKEMYAIVDDSKYVQKLGTKFYLPVEIVPFGWKATEKHINDHGYDGHIRLGKNGNFFVTDNGNYIFDIAKESIADDITTMNSNLMNIPGVVETGFFFNLAKKVFIGNKSGDVTVLTP